MVSVSAPSSPPSEKDTDPVINAARFGVSSRLMDSLLHEVRNPLNAIALNLEVLTQKLKIESGVVPPGQEKNLKSIRDQVGRVDAVMRQFMEFLSDRGTGTAEVDLTELLTRAVDIVGHECRKGRVNLKILLDADVRIPVKGGSDLSFALLQAVFRAVARAVAGAEVTVMLKREGGRAVVKIADGNLASDEPFPSANAALDLICRRYGGEHQTSSGQCILALPLS
jgi:signal transduction histidine kinase